MTDGKVVSIVGRVLSGDLTLHMDGEVDMSVGVAPVEAPIEAQVGESWVKGLRGRRVRVTVEELDG